MSPPHPMRLPVEALALLEYAERHGLLIAPSPGCDEEGGDDTMNPDFLYTAKEVKAELEGANGNTFVKADRYDCWRLVNPNEVLSKLEHDYELAKTYLDDFRKRIALMQKSSRKEF